MDEQKKHNFQSEERIILYGMLSIIKSIIEIEISQQDSIINEGQFETAVFPLSYNDPNRTHSKISTFHPPPLLESPPLMGSLPNITPDKYAPSKSSLSSPT
jgi:hypothetical protein